MAESNHSTVHDLPPHSATIPSKRVALFAYTPGPGAHVDEIAVEEGDLLVLERRFADGWGVARNARTGEKGVFPWDYCFGEEQEQELDQEDGDSNREGRGELRTARDVQTESDFHEGATFRLSGTNIALNLPGSFIDEEAQDLAVKLQTATHIRKSSGIIDRLLLDPDPNAHEAFSVVKEHVPPVRKPTPSSLSINLASMAGDGDGSGKGLTSNSGIRSHSRQSVSSSATSGSLSHSKPSTVSLSHAPLSLHSDGVPFPSSYLFARSGSVSTQGDREFSQDSDFLVVSTADGSFSYRFNLDWKSSKSSSVEDIMGTVGGPGWDIQRSWGYKLSRHDPRSMYFKYEARNRSLRELDHEVPMFSFTIFLFSASLFTSMEHLTYKVPSLHPDIFRTQIVVPCSTVFHRFKWSELIETEWAVIEPPPEFWTPGMDLHVAYVVRDPADNERGETTMRKKMKAEVSKWIDQNMRMGDWAQCQARMSVFNRKSS